MLEVLRNRSTSRIGEQQLSLWGSSFLGFRSTVALFFVIFLGLIVAHPAGALHGMFTVPIILAARRGAKSGLIAGTVAIGLQAMVMLATRGQVLPTGAGANVLATWALFVVTGVIAGSLFAYLTSLRRRIEIANRLRDVAAARATAFEAERERAATHVREGIVHPVREAIQSLDGLIFTDWGNSPEVRRILLSTSERLQGAARESESLVKEVLPARGGNLGVVSLILAELAELEEHTGCDVTVDFQPDVAIPAGLGLTLYRLFCDAVSNIRRHADAHEVSVVLRRDKHTVVLEVKDDGVGFDPDSVSVDQTGGGITRMRQRASVLGGNLELKSNSGYGTSLVVLFPVLTIDDSLLQMC